MPDLAALLHTYNDGLRLGRCLETLYPCDEILIVDHGSTDQTLRIARQYGANIVPTKTGSPSETHPLRSNFRWILCLDPRESLTEGLAASLFELKSDSLAIETTAFAALLREETTDGWAHRPTVQTRLVPGLWNRWVGFFPAEEQSAPMLQGEILRFVFP